MTHINKLEMRLTSLESLVLTLQSSTQAKNDGVSTLELEDDKASVGSMLSEDPYIPSAHSLLKATIFNGAPDGGIIPGRPPLMDPEQWLRMRKEMDEGEGQG